MSFFKNNTIVQEKIKKLISNPPQHKFRGEKRKELIARLYKVEEEKKTLVDFVPFRISPAFATALTTAVILFGYMHFLSPLNPVVFGAKGAVEIYSSRKDKWMPIADGKTRLGKGDIVKTSKDSEADIAISGFYHVRLKGNSEIKLAEASSRLSRGSIKYDLSRGKAFAYYKKGESRKKQFEIQTPEAVLSVRGTGFMVKTAGGAPETWVGVLSGKVKVAGRDKNAPLPKPGSPSVLVEAGEKTVVLRGKNPSKPARLLENELLELKELYGIGEKKQVAILISTGKTRVRELLSLTPLYISAEKGGALPEKIEKSAAIFNRAMEEGSKEKHIESIREFENFIEAYPDPKYDVQFLLFIGAYYEYLDEDAKAAAAFQKIIDGYPASTLQSLALCAIGIIYEEKMNLPAKAAMSYKTILSDYPESPEAYEAKIGLKRLAGKR